MRVPLFLYLCIGYGECSVLRTMRRAAAVVGVAIVQLHPSLVVIADDVPASYDVFAGNYDALDGGKAAELLGLNRLRAEAAKSLRGSVLEVAIGTGLQTQYMHFGGPDGVTSFTGIDMSENMLSEARAKLSKRGVDAKLLQLDASNMAGIADNAFDAVIDTFSMCTFDDPRSVVKEMVRVTRPGGRVVLLENSVSTNPILARFQDITEPIITPLSKGCKWNVRIPDIVQEVAGSGGLLKPISVIDEQAGTITLRVYEKELLRPRD